MATYCTTAKPSPTDLYLYLRYAYPVSLCEHCATHHLERPLSRSKKQNKINNLYFSVNNCALHLARRQKPMWCCLCYLHLASVYLFNLEQPCMVYVCICYIVPGRACSKFKMQTKHHFHKVGSYQF